MADGDDLARKITVFGIPHPLTTAIYLHLEAIAREAWPEGSICELVDRVDRQLLADDGARIYLRPAAVDCIALAIAGPLGASADIPPAYLLADRLDGAWRRLPTLHMERAITDAAYAIERLCERIGVPANERMSRAAREGFRRLREHPAVHDHPLSFLDAIDGHAAGEALAIVPGKEYRVGSDHGGAAMLGSGWSLTHHRARMEADRATLRIVAREPALTLRCLCDGEADTAITASVSGRSVAVAIVPDPAGVELRIPLADGDPTGGPRSFHVELQGAGEGSPVIRSLIAVAEEEEAAAALRSDVDPSMTDMLEDEVAPGSAPDPTLTERLAAMLERRALRTMLWISEEGGLRAAEIDTTAPIPAIAARLADARAGRGGADDMSAGITQMAWPVPGDARYDLVHLHEIARHDDLEALMPGIMAILSHRGVISGCEASFEDARHVVGSLTRRGCGGDMTFVLEEPLWTAFPRRYWKS